MDDRFDINNGWRLYYSIEFMISAYMKAIEYYLPEKTLTNVNLAQEFPEWTSEKVTTKLGIDERRISEESEFVSDMAVKAIQKLFYNTSLKPDDVDFILLCTQSPDYFLPTTACFVQDRLGIPTKCGAIDFNQGCSGYVYGLALAKGLIVAGIARNIVLVTSETYSKHINKDDKSNRAIFGDAAAATWVSSSLGFASIGHFELGTDGAGAKNLIVADSGLKGGFERSQNLLTTNAGLYMNGSEIFSFTLEAVPALITKTLTKNNLTLEDIRWFVYHQANAYMLSFLQKKSGIPTEKFATYMKTCGNTVSSTIPIVLKSLLDENKIKAKQNIVLAGFGVGYSWGGVVLTTT